MKPGPSILSKQNRPGNPERFFHGWYVIVWLAKQAQVHGEPGHNHGNHGHQFDHDVQGRSDISAFPPALSAMGLKASVARVIPRVESIPTAIPSMMVVEGPCWVCAAIPLVALYSSAVNNSVPCPITNPANNPATNAPKIPQVTQPWDAMMAMAIRIKTELPPGSRRWPLPGRLDRQFYLRGF